MFSKRILFLKAALENNSQINTFAIPYEEEQVFDGLNKRKYVETGYGLPTS